MTFLHFIGQVHGPYCIILCAFLYSSNEFFKRLIYAHCRKLENAKKHKDRNEKHSQIHCKHFDSLSGLIY